MPNSESFNFIYLISTSSTFDGTESYSASNATMSELQDTLDSGPGDGMTAIGNSLSWDFTGASTVFWGFSSAGDPVLRVDNAGGGGVFNFYVVSDNGGLAGLVGYDTSGAYQYCFAAGTGIAVPDGEVAVEALAIGDKIQIADGQSTRVLWIGRQTIVKQFSGERAQLVRIAAGALGNHSDLKVTADHGMIVDGLVINASALVNGHSIDWVPMAETPDRFTVYHVETEAHDVILANGAPSETYLDIPGRAAFDNYGEYVDLYGSERVIPEMQRPRISSLRLLPDEIRMRLGIDSAGAMFGTA